MSYNKLIKIVPLILLIFLPVTGLAQELVNPLKHESFEALFEAIFRFIVWLSIALVPIVIVIAGFMLFGAGDQPEKVQTAKTIIKWALIGLLIVLASQALYVVIRNVVDEDFQGYNIENKYVEKK